MDVKRFKAMSAHQRALVGMAVLLDGREAAAYLKIDSVNGDILQEAALDIAGQDLEIRMAFLGTALRAALNELESEGKE